MIRWLFVAIGALMMFGAFRPGAQIVHGRGVKRTSRPIRRFERVLVAGAGLLLIWLVLRQSH